MEKNLQSETLNILFGHLWVVELRCKQSDIVPIICHRCREHLGLRISPFIFEKIWMTLILFSGARGKMIHEKKTSRKKSRDIFLFKKILTNDLTWHGAFCWASCWNWRDPGSCSGGPWPCWIFWPHLTFPLKLFYKEWKVYETTYIIPKSLKNGKKLEILLPIRRQVAK